MYYSSAIMQLARENIYFRHELVTGSHSQVVLMSIPVGEEIGIEVHHVDQLLLFVDGLGQAIIEEETFDVIPDQLVFVGAGTQHNFKNKGSIPLKLISIYCPPEHKPGTLELAR
jgi:mannose-6-phosphate isomerase-like protein (cupin superfamily)